MGEEEYQRVENSCFLYQKDHWNRKNVEVILEEEEEEEEDVSSSINSTISNGSLSSELGDDASSSSNSCSSSLNDLSELMSQLPIKRGLSKFYNGKSESFTSISRVTSIEDLAKKQTPYFRKSKIKSSKSYGGALNNYKLYTLPKSCISKKNKSRGSEISFSCNNSSRRGSFVSSGRHLLMPSEKNFGC